MKIEEIKKAVEENPELGKQIAVWASGTEKGKELLTDFAKTKVDAAVNEKTKEIYTNLDNDLFEVLGERKGHDQKTYDFLKAKAKELKALKEKEGKLDESEKVKELKAKIKEYEDKGVANEHWKRIYDEAREEWKTSKEALEAEKKKLQSEFLEAQIEADLKAGLAKITFKKDIPQRAIDAIVAEEKAAIIKNAKIIEGKPVYHKENGEPMYADNFKPISSDEIWKTKLGEFIDDGKTTPTGGGGASGNIKEGKAVRTGEGDTAGISLELDTSTFSTKKEYTELADKALRKLGVKVGSKEYYDAMLEGRKKYEVDKMDME